MFCNKCGIDVRSDATCNCIITDVNSILNWSVESQYFDTLFDYPKNFFLISQQSISFRNDKNWESYSLNIVNI